MLFEAFIGFLSLVLYQMVAKKYNFPLISNGLTYLRDTSTTTFEWLGEVFGKLTNIYEWYSMCATYIRQVWNFAKRIWVDVWNFINYFFTPFFESVEEVGRPLYQFLFSWGYFFVGFANTPFLILSYLGLGVLVMVFGYSMIPLVLTYSMELAITSCTIFVGLFIAFPNILPKMFPTLSITYQSIVDCCTEPFVVINEVKYTRGDLKTCKLNQLQNIVSNMGLDPPRTKKNCIDLIFKNQ